MQAEPHLADGLGELVGDVDERDAAIGDLRGPDGTQLYDCGKHEKVQKTNASRYQVEVLPLHGARKAITFQTDYLILGGVPELEDLPVPPRRGPVWAYTTNPVRCFHEQGTDAWVESRPLS